MKRIIQEALLAILLGVGVPGMMFSATPFPADPEPPVETVPIRETEPVRESTIQLLVNGETVTLTLDDYLVGVLLRELPGDFHMEAKKAQAVAARSYTLKTAATGAKHPVGVICGDSGCCQAYCDPEEYLASGGREDVLEEARTAVAQTHGQVLTYGGKIIDATYFSCSGGYTEDALAVWGADIPYLQAVESPGEENASHYGDEVHFSLSEFCDCLDIRPIDLMGYGVEDLTCTKGGGVDTVSIGGKTFTGTELRQLLSLRSTAMTIEVTGSGVTVSTRGFGHRVGMSQYGADAMAVSGSTYQEILTHYYQNAQLEVYGD